MPRYRVVIPSRWEPDRAFAYMADFSNAAEWDPSVVHASTVMADSLHHGTAFDLVVSTGGRQMPLRYEVIDRGERRITFRAQTRTLESVDTITVSSDPGGSRVEYDARLTLRGIGRVFNPLLGPAFHRIGERARHSLAGVLARSAP